MNGVLVVDASAIVATLVDDDERGTAAANHMLGADLIAPDFVGYEVLNALRGLRTAKKLSRSAAEIAFRDWARYEIDLWPLMTFADRLWQLTDNLTAYDAAYVSLAERLDVPLLTGDHRLAKAPGIRAEVLVI